MDEQKRTKIKDYFESCIADCRERERALTADDRTDEAAFEKIRANVYGIFQAVFSVAGKSGADERDFFLQKLEQIPSAWREAYTRAEQHGDEVRMQQERLKLDAAAEIGDSFLTIWEGAE